MKNGHFILGAAFAIASVTACNTEKNYQETGTKPQPDDVLSVVRDANGDYIIKFKTKGKRTIFNSTSESQMNWSNSQQADEIDSLRIPCSFPDKRLFFAVVDGQDTLYVSEKHIPMAGSPNFRDMGGIVNKDGKQVRWGSFFRSGSLADLTDTDLKYFQTLHIQKVIDFRTDSEVKREPDRYPDSLKPEYIRAVIGNPAMIDSGLAKGKLTPAMADSFMIAGSMNFVKSLSDFKPVIQAMTDGNGQKPFLFHCTAGKDRTGLAGALILMILNVDRDIIMKDYLLSNQYILPYFEKNKDKMKFYDFDDDVMKVLWGVKAAYLQASFDEIDKEYGSTENMLEKVFGIDSSLRKQLIEKYTL